MFLVAKVSVGKLQYFQNLSPGFTPSPYPKVFTRGGEAPGEGERWEVEQRPEKRTKKQVRRSSCRRGTNAARLLISKRVSPTLVFPSTDFGFSGLFAPGWEHAFAPGLQHLLQKTFTLNIHTAS